MAQVASATESTNMTLREAALRGVPLTDTFIVNNHSHLGLYYGFAQPAPDADSLVRTMDRVGIDQSCVFSSLAITADMRTGNDKNLEAARQHPGRLLAYAVPDPNLARQVRDEMQRCVDAGVRGIKFHTGIHEYPFAGPAYVPAFELADKHRLPLISHGVDSPDVLRRTARAYPNAHFIVAHAGAGGRRTRGDAINQVALEEPNVYLDTAGSVAPYGAFAQLVNTVGAGRILFGDDFPWMCPTHQIGRILLAPITDDEKKQILGGTMQRLLSTRR
jgi:predicted TIM-barrel fold metal-dependent hydrolase